jgi:hypothetical protein
MKDVNFYLTEPLSHMLTLRRMFIRHLISSYNGMQLPSILHNITVPTFSCGDSCKQDLQNRSSKYLGAEAAHSCNNRGNPTELSMANNAFSLYQEEASLSATSHRGPEPANRLLASLHVLKSLLEPTIQ